MTDHSWKQLEAEWKLLPIVATVPASQSTFEYWLRFQGFPRKDKLKSEKDILKNELTHERKASSGILCMIDHPWGAKATATGALCSDQ